MIKEVKVELHILHTYADFLDFTHSFVCLVKDYFIFLFVKLCMPCQEMTVLSLFVLYHTIRQLPCYAGSSSTCTSAFIHGHTLCI